MLRRGLAYINRQPPPARTAPRTDPAYRDLTTSYKDSYAVCALAVAYDLTGDAKYLETCRKWSERTLDLQSRMTPIGAY